MIIFKSRYFKYLNLFLVSGLILIFLHTYLWNYLLTYLQPIAGAPTFIGYQVGRDIKDQLANSFNKGSLVEQIKILENKVLILESGKAKGEDLILENNRLRQELALLPSYNFLTTGVEIIGRRQTLSSITYIINKGSYHNLKNGLPVITESILVGKIVNVQRMFSEIILIASPLFLTTTEVLNDQASRGIIQGEFNLGTRINYLPVDDVVAAGQTVITSGLDELVPRGLTIGYITSVEKKEDHLFQSAIVAPPFDLNKLRFLRVVISTITSK